MTGRFIFLLPEENFVRQWPPLILALQVENELSSHRGSVQKTVVGWPGLEPGTNGLKGRCSTD